MRFLYEAGLEREFDLEFETGFEAEFEVESKGEFETKKGFKYLFE